MQALVLAHLVAPSYVYGGVLLVRFGERDTEAMTGFHERFLVGRGGMVVVDDTSLVNLRLHLYGIAERQRQQKVLDFVLERN